MHLFASALAPAGQPHAEPVQDPAVQRRIRAAIMEAADQFVGMVGNPFDQSDLFNDLYGSWMYSGYFVPPAYYQSQKRGEVIPVYLNELQLRWIRDRMRKLCAENPFAQAVIANYVNYAVGENGLTFECVPAHGQCNDSHLRQCQRIIDVWNEANDMSEYEQHGVETLIINGAWGTRHFPQDDGIVFVRPFEEEHLRSPVGDAYDARHSFGIETAKGDVEDRRGYWIVEEPLDNPNPTFVPADQVTYIKGWTPRSAKRGLPLFYSTEMLLRGAVELLRATMATVTARAKIGMIRRFDGVVKDAAKKLVDELTTQTVTNPGNNQTINMQKMGYSSIINSSTNMQYEFPAQNFETNIHDQALKMCLRAIAVRCVIPEWMIAGDPSSGTYDNAFIAESPGTKNFLRFLKSIARVVGSNRISHRRSMAWVQICHAVKVGLLAEDVLHTVQVKTEGPSVIVRDKAEEATTNKIMCEMRIKSPQTWQQEAGLDPKQEAKNFEEIDKRNQAEQERQFKQQLALQQAQGPAANTRDGGEAGGRREPATRGVAMESEQGDLDEDDVDTQDLAHFYAELWAKRHPKDIGDHELATADAELGAGAHSVAWDDTAGQWRVLSPAGNVEEAAMLEAVHRAPKGGVTIDGKKFKGGMFIPAGDYAKASAEEKAAIDNPAKAAADKRRARGVDKDKLREKLKAHSHHELSREESTAARRSLAAIRRHHADLTHHRLDELADRLQAAIDNTKSKKVRKQLSRRLRAVEHQLDVLEEPRETRPANTLYKRIREGGGIDVEALQKDFDVKTEFIESGLLGLLVGNKAKARLKATSAGPRGLDQWAETLQTEGHIQVPANRRPDDYLLELLQTKSHSLHDDVESELKDIQAQRMREMEELTNAGADQSEIEEAIRAGQEGAQAEALAGEDQAGLGELADEEGFQGNPDDLTFDPAEFEQEPKQSPRPSPRRPRSAQHSAEQTTSGHFLDYQQKDADHPFAKKIKADVATAERIEAVRTKTQAQQPVFQRHRELLQSEKEAWTRYKDLAAEHGWDPGSTPEATEANPPPAAVAAARSEWFDHDQAAQAHAEKFEQARQEALQVLIEHVRPERPAELAATMKTESAIAGKALARSKDFIEGITAGTEPIRLDVITEDPTANYVEKAGGGILDLSSYVLRDRDPMFEEDAIRDAAETCVHELGHALEHQKPGVWQAAQQFLDYRCGDEPYTDLGTIHPEWEGKRGRKDDWEKAFGPHDAYYVGRDYGDDSTEVISMGLEALYKDPIGFMEKDPEYVHFLLGVLRS